MFKTLSGRLAVAFLALSVGAVALVSVLMNVTVERRFEEYIRENVEARADRIAIALGRAYAPGTGWSPDLLMEITHWSLMEGLAIQVESPPGKTIWMSVEAAKLLTVAPDVVTQSQVGVEPHPLQITRPIFTDGHLVGQLRLSTGTQGLFTEHDLHFRREVNRVLLGSAAAAAGVALVAGLLMARGLNRPIRHMTRVAEKMERGEWGQRVPMHGVTELRRLGEALNHLAESLQSQEEMRRRLTRDVAHELRTPLAVLQSHLEAMEDGIWQPTPPRVQLLQGEVMRLVRLVEDLNRLTEAEAGALKLAMADTTLRGLLDPLGAGYGQLFAEKKITLTYIPPEKDVRIRTDRDKVMQILTNLLANAHKFTPAGGQVTLKATVAGECARISVRDTGPGISPQDLPHIFARLYRGDPARVRATGGAGLGLAIAKVLTEALGGKLEVDSQPGEGAEFTLLLPLEGKGS